MGIYVLHSFVHMKIDKVLERELQTLLSLVE